MIQRDLAPESADLIGVRAHFAAGHYVDAFRGGVSAWRSGPAPERRHAIQLAVRAAHRLGNFGDAVALMPDTLEAWADHVQSPDYFDLLRAAVMALGGMGRYKEMLEAMRQMHSHPSRSACLTYHVRARMLAAVGLALMGDTWAGLRILAEAAAHLGGLRHLPEAEQIEAAVWSNHAGVCLMTAWLHRDQGDIESCEQHTILGTQSAARARELALAHGEQRLAAFSDLQDAEFAMVSPRRRPPFDLAGFRRFSAHVTALQLHGEVRTISMVLAQALHESGKADEAASVLDSVEAALRPEHELSSRIRYWRLRHTVCRALGDTAAALKALEQWSALQLADHAALLHANSTSLRLRLELEHLYRQPWRGTP